MVARRNAQSLAHQHVNCLMSHNLPSHPHPTLAHILLLPTRFQKQDAPLRLAPEPPVTGGRRLSFWGDEGASSLKLFSASGRQRYKTVLEGASF